MFTSYLYRTLNLIIMKRKLLITCLISYILLSCSSDDSNYKTTELTGKWKLTEAYIDPGDGSGEFQKVESKKIIEFKKNKRISSNVSLCINSMNWDEPDLGTYEYNVDEKSQISGIITPSSCNSYHFEIKNSELYIYYLCIEGCGEKYIKIE